MQRWEYCSLWRREGAPERWYLTTYGADGTAEEELAPDSGNGERSLRAAWGRTIARMGLAGWELVAADAAGFYFKRALPGEAGDRAARPARAATGRTAGLLYEAHG